MYSLIVTAKMNGVDPQTWLADVLTRIAAHPAHRLRPTGATISDLSSAGFKYAAVAARKIAERHGYKTTSDKKKGELTIYKATRKAGGS
jgi:hypothetical protein